MFSSMKKSWKGGTSFHKHFLEQLQSQISQSSFCLQTMPLRNHAWLNSLASWTAIASDNKLFFPSFTMLTPLMWRILMEALRNPLMSIWDRPETQYIKDIVAYVMQKLMKHQVFLSLGEDTRLNFTNHLVNALEKVGINVFPDNETLKKGEKLPPTYSRAISASNLSILVLSADYASSKSCLVELSDIMIRKHYSTDKHIVLPSFTMLILPMCEIVVGILRHPSKSMNQSNQLIE
ncbi:hypothetical protein V6Z12_D10G282900 [Gossypium hirsutum]